MSLLTQSLNHLNSTQQCQIGSNKNVQFFRASFFFFSLFLMISTSIGCFCASKTEQINAYSHCYLFHCFKIKHSLYPQLIVIMNEFHRSDYGMKTFRVYWIHDAIDIGCSKNQKKILFSMRSLFETGKYITKKCSMQGFEFECHAFESTSALHAKNISWHHTTQTRKSCNDDKININTKKDSI